jgi:indole-3-glycerol phosphate synthase
MVLDRIVEGVRGRLDSVRRREIALRRAAQAAAPALDFSAALLAGPRPAMIAELKRRSPVTGLLDPAYDVAVRSRAYAAGGASALSVLTNPDFDGSLEDLAAARAVLPRTPLLRKDFLIDDVQLTESRAHGADCVLLIVRILGPAQLVDLAAVARGWGMQTLVEVHGEDEVDAALAAQPDLVGVNSRDLTTFSVRGERLAAVTRRLPAGIPTVAESGIATRDHVVAAGNAGARAVLVGETLMRAANPEAKVRELLGGVA